VGDRETDMTGQVIGEIIELGKPEPFTYELNVGQGEILIKEDQNLKKMFVTLKLNAELRGNMLYYKNKPILFRTPINFNTVKYHVEAEYVSIENDPTLSLMKITVPEEKGVKLIKKKQDIIMKKQDIIMKKQDIIIEYSSRKVKRLIEKLNND
ncbi:hypothetical protein ACFLZ3_01550, partial [Candidatus Omnitrophota bacterium]